MKKIQVHIRIDSNIMWALRTTQDDLNFTKLINDLLRGYISSKTQDQDIIQLADEKIFLLQEEKIIEEQLRQTREKLSILEAEIKRKEAEEIIRDKERHQISLNVVNSIKASGIMRDML